MLAIPSSKDRTWAGICLVLASLTLILYWPLKGHDFINIDDPRFVTQNPHVQAGLTWPGIVWAFQSVYTENWHPLTWISHMMDCQFYGLNPAGHHLTSLLFHIANTLLLFLLLNRLTSALWRSALVAAFFAWHPLHVESVAWVAERKDVLSTFFWLLTLLAYARYTRKPNVPGYLWTLLLFACGLMSKPMVVTLPLVALLIDFWPLNRFKLTFTSRQNRMMPEPVAESSRRENLWRTAGILVAEKIPFFLLTLIVCVMTLYAQKTGGSMLSLAALPIHTRIENVLVSYAGYLSKTFWPVNLAVFYPYNLRAYP